MYQNPSSWYSVYNVDHQEYKNNKQLKMYLIAIYVHNGNTYFCPIQICYICVTSYRQCNFI